MSALDEILSDLQWDEGISLPIANDNNKLLSEKLQSKKSKISNLSHEVEELNDRITAISEHMKNVSQELQHSQKLLVARGSEKESESHMLIISNREQGRLRAEIVRLQNILAEVKDRRNTLENNIFRKNQIIEGMISQFDHDRNALEVWLNESKEKDEDYMTLQKYTRHDDLKIKELDLKIQALTEEDRRKKKQLDSLVTETLTLQLALDKAAEEFRSAHIQRQELISQWEKSIDAMKIRDKEINELSIYLAEVKNSLFDTEKSLVEEKEFYNQATHNNDEKEKDIEQKDRILSRLKTKFVSIDSTKKQFKDELEALKNTVEKSGLDLELARIEVGKVKQDIDVIQNRLESCKLNNNSLKDKLKEVSIGEMTADEKAKLMDEILEDEEKRIAMISKSLDQLHSILYKKQQHLYTATNKLKHLEAQKIGNISADKNLQSQIIGFDAALLKQQELIYSQDYNIQMLEKRIWHMQTTSKANTEEQEQLNKTVKELNEALKNLQKKHSLLTLQLKRLVDDDRKLKKMYKLKERERQDLTEKIDELHMYNECAFADLDKLKKHKYQLVVTENLVNLELKRIRANINSKSEEIIDLEKKKLWIQTATKERREEIRVHQEMLKTQIKLLSDEKNTISSELQERISKIEKLRNRYEITRFSMSSSDNEEAQSASFYILKALQEKEELQRFGDELDAKIRKSEKEIKALENTLTLMNGRNETCRKSFTNVPDTSEEIEQRDILLQRLKAVNDKQKYKRRQLSELSGDLFEMKNTGQYLIDNSIKSQALTNEYSINLKQLSKEIELLDQKLGRAQNEVKRFSDNLRTDKKSSSETLEERDFKLRDLRDFNRSVIKDCLEISKTVSGARQPMTMLFNQVGIDISMSISMSSRGSVSRLSTASSRHSSGHNSIVPKSVPLDVSLPKNASFARHK